MKKIDKIKKDLHELLDNDTAAFSDDGEYNISFSELAFADEIIDKVANYIMEIND